MRLSEARRENTFTISFLRVLRHKPATDREVKDDLAQNLDVFGAGGEARDVLKKDRPTPRCQGAKVFFIRFFFLLGVLASWRGTFFILQLAQASHHQLVAPLLTLVLCRLQPITQGHQLIDLGNNAVLFR